MKLGSAFLTSRRALFIGGGAAAALGAGALMLRSDSGAAGKIGHIDKRKITALGDGFYLADGWVLTADDLKAMGLPHPGGE